MHMQRRRTVKRYLGTKRYNFVQHNYSLLHLEVMLQGRKIISLWGSSPFLLPCIRL